MSTFVKSHLNFLLVCLVTILFASCTKEKETAPVVVPPITTALSPQKASYAPFELVVIKAPKNALGTQALEGLINAQKVQVIANDTLAIFIMPDIANGTYTLTLTANGKDYAMPVGVLALTNVQSSDVYFNAIESQVNRNLAAINAQADALVLSGVPTAETQALKQNAQQYATQFGTYKVAYQNLSASDKQNFARAMAANKPGDDEYQALTAAAVTQANALRGMQTVSNYEASVDAGMKTHAVLIAYTVLHIPLIIVEANFFYATLNPFMFAALSITVASFLINATLARASVGTLLNKALKPFQNLNIDQTAYSNGTDVTVEITAQYRSLTLTDETAGSGGSILDAGLAKYKLFRNAFNDLASKLPTSLRPTAIVSVLKAQATTLSRTIYNSYVRTSNNSNPAVTLTQLNQADGSLKIRATTTTATSQSFAYDLTYANTGFSSGLTKRVSAQVTVTANSYCEGIPFRFDSVQVVYYNLAFINGFMSRPYELRLHVKGGNAPYTIVRSITATTGYGPAQTQTYSASSCGQLNNSLDLSGSIPVTYRGIVVPFRYTITDSRGVSYAKTTSISY